MIVTSEIIGQEITEVCSYCFLYEPLRVSIVEDNQAANKIFIDLQIIDTKTGIMIIFLVKYFQLI